MTLYESLIMTQNRDTFVTINKETKDTPEEVTKVPLNDILREQIVTYL